VPINAEMLPNGVRAIAVGRHHGNPLAQLASILGRPIRFPWAVAAKAQTTPPVIGFFSSRSSAESASVVAEFRQGLDESCCDEL
jgi:hypothetical protein